MQNVYLEWFLLDNTLMAYLILRTAAALARLPYRSWLLYVVSIFSALFSAAAMINPVFLSIPAKVILLVVMTLPTRWKTRKQWGRTLIAVLASTFLFGGTAYALAFFFESDFHGGVLYASSSVRGVLVAAVIALWVPTYIRRMIQLHRVSRTRIFLHIQTRFGETDLHARLDTGHSLFAEEAPVIVVDAKASANVLPSGWADGMWYECGVPGMGILPFNTASDTGIMPTLPATVNWRWEEEIAYLNDVSFSDALLKPAGIFWEANRNSTEKRSFFKKREEKKAKAWLETRACRIAVASSELQDCQALVGLDFIELH